MVKTIVKKIVGKKNIERIRYAKYLKEKNNQTNLFRLLIKTKVIKNNKCKSKQILNLFKKIKIKAYYDNFYYYIDIYKHIYTKNRIVDNLTFNYEYILDNSLNDIKNRLIINKEYNSFYNEEILTIDAIDRLISRITKATRNKPEIYKSILNIKNEKASGFYDALQRILFFNQILWQTGHRLNGIGRLDYILNKYYIDDLSNNIITKDKAKELLREFLEILHKDYYYKSNNLSGDTGQIIVLGGLNEDGTYFSNDITYMLIDIIKELQYPDPKIFLRTSKNAPRDLIEKSVECIQTGIGCPLYANDDVIISKLINFGYDSKDAYNYGTSACWEPFLVGNSFDMNNLKSINFIKPLEEMLANENLSTINESNEFLRILFNYLEEYIYNIIIEVNSYKWENDPILSLATNLCTERGKDISDGGAKYNNYGFTGVGLSNLVNSIITVNKYVFEDKTYTLEEFNNICISNFDKYEKLRKYIKRDVYKYGKDDNTIIDLTNSIIRFVSVILNKYRNPLGGKYKFGLSAPSYIDEAIHSKASFDGRKNGEPFGVHISSSTVKSYTELINFASQLDYNDNRFNGNVVDFFVTPSFIEDNFYKFVDFILYSIDVGFFEMQMNVISSKILIDAKENPDKFPNLIVRVWGFSAYFKDLPDIYKDYLIERAVQNESNCK